VPAGSRHVRRSLSRAVLVPVGAALVLTGAGVSAVAASPVTAAAPVAVTASATEQQEFQLLDLINQERSRNGLQPMLMQLTLRDYARSHAADQANAGSIWHDMAEYQRWAPAGWTRLGENVAYNQSVTAMHQAYMNSPGHRQNILNPDFNYVGIGIVATAGGRLYNSEDFMAHPDRTLPTVSAAGTNPAPAPNPPAPAPAPAPTPAPAPNEPPPPIFDPRSFPGLDLTWWYSLFG
jgi:uncharacterized protein YkwD